MHVEHRSFEARGGAQQATRHQGPLKTHKLRRGQAGRAFGMADAGAPGPDRAPRQGTGGPENPAGFRQFGPDYARMDNFKRKFRQVLRDVRAVYPDARLEIDDHGITLFHSPPPVRRRLIPAG